MAAGHHWTRHTYSNALGVIARIVGPSAWVPRWLNVVLGAIVAVLAFEIARQFFGRRAARIAGVVVALWPSLVLWSVLVLKDAAVHVAFGIVMLAAIAVFRGSLIAVVPVGAASACLVELRRYAFVVAQWSVGVVAVGLMARARRIRAPIVAVLLVLIAVGMATNMGAGSWTFIRKFGDAQSVHQARLTSAHGSTALAPEDDKPLTGLGDVVRDLPRAIPYVVLGPYPWSPGQREAKVLVLFELPAWYAALGFGVVQLVRGRRQWFPSGAHLVLAVLGVTAIVALYQRNAGTALRQRGMVIPLVVVFAAGAVDELIQRRRAAHSSSYSDEMSATSRSAP